ncbi:MAG: hypothetical protein JXR31_13340, partial [Prolixibacteraceae bacterium]|nr:hypothetical protein [Prolixibacteraceae bacterium]
MARFIFQILAVLVVILYLSSCEDDKYMNSPDAQLEFSTDTVMFDTIFTTLGSTTRHLKIYNPYNDKVLISKVRLAGGEFSSFRLNVNGLAAYEVYDLEVPAQDSIYIFVEVTIDPNGQNLPMVVKDSIEFTTNTNVQDVDLVAWGQDFKRIKGEVLTTATWTNEKPYLVYDYAYVDTLGTLTIEEGTRIHFHKGAGLYARGNIIAKGTYENPIIFQSDRLEDSYKDIPEQWQGIILFSGSKGNVFDYVQIKNAITGLQVGTIEHEGNASLEISNSRIENMSYAGLFSVKSDIRSYNNIIANCGFYCAALLVGGNYEFYHTTIANFWGGYSSKVRSSASLALSNVLVVKQEDGSNVVFTGDLNNATFGNCIIYGNVANEIELGKNQEVAFNYLFDHCILMVQDTFNTSDNDHYKNVWKGL